MSDQQDEQATTCPWCGAKTTHAYPVEHDRTRLGTRFFECGSSWCFIDGMRPQHERCRRDLDKIAEGERAATERILERIDQSLHVYREHAGARGALYALRCRVADAIERGEHEQR